MSAVHTQLSNRSPPVQTPGDSEHAAQRRSSRANASKRCCRASNFFGSRMADGSCIASASAQRFSDKMAELDIQRAKLEEMDERGAEIERQCANMRDRVQARKMQLEFDAEAAATEQAGLSADECVCRHGLFDAGDECAD